MNGYLEGFAKRGAALLVLAASLASCAAGGDASMPITFTDDRGVSNQPYPTAYRTDILAFFRTYLNDPRGVHDAAIAEPVQRTIGGRLRYVTCLRYNARDSDGTYQGVQERGIVFVDGRLDRALDNSAEACAGVQYASFPELEKLTR